MGCGVELIDIEKRRSIVPGVYAPPYFRSKQAMLVAGVGDTIQVYDETWKVEKRLFTYERLEHDDEESHCTAHLYCRRLPDGDLG